MEEIERAQERLQHIRSVEPILDALRMIALGSWQKATKQQAVSQAYSDRLLAVLRGCCPTCRSRGGRLTNNCAARCGRCRQRARLVRPFQYGYRCLRQ
ncbi:MAG: hypothetical protein M5U34_06715 [Chloroflexi bacterium]|nr:hypothetical protein [Chloroflexota bacterium]